MFIGLGDKTEGTVIVKNGGKITFTAPGAYGDNTGLLQVGSTGTGTLIVEKGGVVSVKHLRAGNGDNGKGYIHINGGTVTVTSKIHIANMTGTEGTVLIDNGGTFTTKGVSYVGNYAGTTGIVKVDNGTWSSTSWISIGETGKGSLTLENGGQLGITGKYSSLYVGHLTSSEGTVTIEDGTIDSASDIQIGIGTSSTGTVTLKKGSIKSTAVTIAGGSSSTGTLTLSSGTLTTATVNIASKGTGTVSFENDAVAYVDTFTFGGNSSSSSSSIALLEIKSSSVKLLNQAGTGLSSLDGGTYGSGTLLFEHTGDLDFLNSLSGKNLKVEHKGTGKTTLGASNSYERGTDIYAGNLVATGDTSFGTGDIHFLGTATVTLDQADTILANNINIDDSVYATLDSLDYHSSITGVIAGQGALVKEGTGDLTLGANTYAGGTYMDQGNLVLTDNSSLGTGDVYFTGDSGLTFGAPDLVIDNNLIINSGVTATLHSNGNDAEMTGKITGGTRLKKEGTGTITFTCTDSHELGGVHIHEGALIFQNQTILGEVVIKDTAALTVQGESTINTLDMEGHSHLNVEADTSVLSDTILIDDSVVTVSDDKTLSLTGGSLEVNIYGTGGTVTNQGTLTAKSFEGNFENSGTATILDVGNNVLNDGTITLGGDNLIWGGTLTNNGLVDFPNISNKLTVSGLAGTGGAFGMEISMLTGDTSHLLIQGGSSPLPLSRLAPGTFQLIMTDVSADPNKIDPLEYNMKPVIVRDTANTGAVFTGNFDAGLWNYEIISIDGPNGAVDWVPSLTTEYSAEGSTLINMTGTIASGWFSQLDNLHKRMGEFRLVKGASNASMEQIASYINCSEIWVRTFGQQVNTDLGIAGLSRFREYQFGGDFGFDRAFARNSENLFIGGVFAGYQRGEREFRGGNPSTADSDTFYGGLYGTWLHKEGWYADLVLKGERYEQTYRIRGNDADKGHYLTPAFGVSLEFGKQIALENNWFIEPSIQGAYLRIIGQDHTSYRGLHADYSNANVYQIAATVRGGKTYTVNNTYLQPYAKTGLVEQISSGGRVSISDRSWRPSTDGLRAIVGAGIMWQLNSKDQFHLDYEASFADKTTVPWSINLGYRRSF